jgi:hypothetical protein
MCFLWGTNWGFISQKTAFFIVTAVKTSGDTNLFIKVGTKIRHPVEVGQSVGFACGLRATEFVCLLWKFCKCPRPWGHHNGGRVVVYVAPSQEPDYRSAPSMQMLLTTGDRELPHSHATFPLQELIIHLRIYGSQANLEQVHTGFCLQHRPFRLIAIIM